MTHTLGTHFKKLLVNIRPPDERIEKAQTLPHDVRNYLAQHDAFETQSPHSRLAGSYAQDLTVGDVKDVDFLVRVDGNPEENDPPARDVLTDLKAALDGLPEYLGKTGLTELQVDRNRRSVHVGFEEYDFHLDVVPCIAPDGFDKALYVPDWGLQVWVESHPLGVVATITELEAEHSGKFRNLTKLLKHFRNTHMTYMQPKSYWLVTMSIEAVESGEFDTTEPLAVVFDQLLNYLYDKYHLTYLRDGAVPEIPDPMLGHDVAWNWERSHFESFMRRLEDGKKWTSTALDKDDKDQAIKLWRKVFGDKFPETVDEYASQLAESRRPGAAAVTPAGLILPGDEARPGTIRIPPTRYYGDG